MEAAQNPELAKLKSPKEFEYYRLSNPLLPADSFIVRHESFRDVLYHPQLAGIDLQEKMQHAGRAFSRAIFDLALSKDGVKRENLAELVLLSGGLFYNLNFGFKKEFGFSLPQCFVGVKREKIAGTDGEFKANISYENFESMPDDAVILVADTLATGASLEHSLLHAGKWMASRKKKIRKIVFATLAGSLCGAKKLARAHAEISRSNPGLKTSFIAAEQIFHLMPNGTDLRFLGADAVYPRSTYDYTLDEYGKWLGENMKCAVFDWGNRCKNPRGHLIEFEHAARSLLAAAPDKKSKSEIMMRLDQTLRQHMLYVGKLKK